MNPNVPNVWNVWNSHNAQVFQPFPPQPRPLMSLPMSTPPIQIFHPPFDANNGLGRANNRFNHVASTPPYAGITDPVFARQVPARFLPHLRFPPPNPPYRGQPIWNPYIINSFPPAFGYLFDTMINENLVPEERSGELYTSINEFRSLSLDKQLDQFMFARTLSAEQVQMRWQLVMDILFVLRQKFPMCEVHAFGSAISGLGDMASDVDIYVDLFGPSANASPLPPGQTLQQATRALRNARCPHTGRSFHNSMNPVTHARIPVLKVEHAVSFFSFDLTFSNLFSVQNSKLITFYNKFDPRVFRFMVIIRYWLKFHHISGSDDIKNYALCLLGLVYLMQKEIIPSVHILQKLEETQRRKQAYFLNPFEIDGWDASFCENFELINQHFQRRPIPPDFNENPTKHLLNMVMEFCKMCAHTDFGAVVVCPYLGEFILKGGFTPGNEIFLTDMLDRYKKFTFENNPSSRLKLKSPLCIQDPFELNFNVTNGAKFATIIKFQIACAKTAQVLSEKLKENDIADGSLSIMDLFIPLPSHLKKDKELIRGFRVNLTKKRVQKEILCSLGLKADVIHFNREEEEETIQENKYTMLPRHLAQLDKVIDHTAFQAWKREHSSCELANISLRPNFSREFIAEVARCGLVNIIANDVGEKLNLEMLKLKLAAKVASLWREFALDFLDQIFSRALKLSVDDEQVLEAFAAIDDGLDPEDFCGLDAWSQSWKIEVPLEATERSSGRKEEFLKKISTIKDIPKSETGYYRKITIQVSYPFWRDRAVVLKEWKENEKKITIKTGGKIVYTENPIEVEAEISENFLKQWHGKVYDGKKNVGDDDANGDVVQIVEEGPQSSIKRPRMEKFTPFKVDALVKISTRDCNSLDLLERPKMVLIFQSKTEENIFLKPAVAKLYSIIQNAFPEYQEYRLHEYGCPKLEETEGQMRKKGSKGSINKK